jgi:hypothetical protein
MLILICDPDEMRAKLWASALIQELECQVHITRKLENAIGYIQTFPTLDLIIAPTESSGRDLAKTLTEKVRELSKSLKILFFGKEEISGQHIYFLKREPLVKILLTKVREILGKVDNFQSYIPVPLTLLNDQVKAPCDFYLRLSKDTFSHMTVVCKTGDTFAIENLKKLESKNCHELWISKDSKSIFYTQLLQSLESHAQNDEESVEGDQTTRCTDFVLNSVTEFGIPADSANSLLDKILSEQKSLSLDKALADLQKNKVFSSFSLKSIHPIMTTLIAFHLLGKQTWQNPAHWNSIIVAANMMDAELEDDKEILVRDQSEFDLLNLNRGEKFRLINHAANAYELSSKNKKISSSVLSLIKMHHGSFNGTGYNEGPVSKLEKINLLFNFSEELSCYLFKNRNKNWTREDFLTSLSKRFPKPEFLKELLNL